MRRKKDRSWLVIGAFVVFAVIALALNGYNTVQVCKTQDVYWVSGTQYSCKWFK